MTFPFSYVRAPVATMRENPDPMTDGVPTTKVASQALYGERVTILEEQGDWAKIATPDDQYVGWIKKETLGSIPEGYFQDGPFIKTNRLAAHLYHTNDTEYGPILTLPFGRPLKLLQEVNHRWLKVQLLDAREAYIQRGDVDIHPRHLAPHEIIDFAKRFLGVPYTWGGRSSFGYDCSGFMQMLFKEMGYSIPRDAKDQYAWKDVSSVSMDTLLAGDLIFFGPEKTTQKITHVGMYTGNGNFIHAGTKRPGPFICIANLQDEDWKESTIQLPFQAAKRHFCFIGDTHHS